MSFSGKGADGIPWPPKPLDSRFRGNDGGEMGLSRLMDIASVQAVQRAPVPRRSRESGYPVSFSHAGGLSLAPG